MSNLSSLPAAFPTKGGRRQDVARRVAWPILLAILLGGLALRTWNVNFDRGTGSHPDERSTACFYAPSLRLPASWEQFWNPQASPLNPLWDLNENRRRSYTYGHFPLYLGVAAGHVLEGLAPAAEAVGAPAGAVTLMQRAATACDGIAVAGRLTIALLDTLTILLLYLLGGRFGGRAAGLLAAAFYAFTAQAIQLSHFFAMDPASTTFTVLAVLAAVNMLRGLRLRDALVAGLGIGLAVSSKFSALPLLVVPLVAALLAVWRSWAESRRDGHAPDGRVPLRALVGVFVAWVVAGLAFFLTSPYAVLDWQSFVQATLVEQGAMVRGVADMPFTRQYRNTIPYIYFIQQQLQWGMGWALGLVATAGTLFAVVAAGYTLWRIGCSLLRKHVGPVLPLMPGVPMPANPMPANPMLANLVVWSWVLPYFGLTGAFLAKFNRYMSPLLPFVLLWAAWLIVWLWGLYDRRNSASAYSALASSGEESGEEKGVRVPDRGLGAAGWVRPLAATLAVVGVLGGIFWSFAYVNGVYNREHTWLTASRWMYENIPSGSTILWEVWDDPLPKTIPDEPGMDMYSRGLSNINWVPYEEDTADKYQILKQKLREADYVAYSSKRIYDSVDELPQRYPMTNLYYAAMRDGRLGFELAAEFTSPPQLFGVSFDDRHADESWSLYDHPQVSVYRKVRDLSDAEFDALFNRAWEQAQHGYRGPDSPISPLLNLIGLGSAPGSENAGLINRVIGLMSGAQGEAAELPGERRSLLLETPLRELPVVDNYRWNVGASESTVLAVLTWWLLLTLLGLLAWPLLFVLLRPLRDRGYFVARTFGWLLGGWLLWMLVSVGLLQNLVAHAWLSLALLAVPCLYVAWRNRGEMKAWLRGHWPLLLVGEVVFGAAYLFFVGIRMLNPDLWQPWYGGEKQMEFAFLNGILRSPTFPPLNPHFAGGVINYYYFGLYLVAYLIKLTGIYAEVAFNLTIATLFALTVVNSFAVVYSAARAPHRRRSPESKSGEDPAQVSAVAQDSSSGLTAPPWRWGVGAALLGPLFVTLIGNLDGFAQVVRNLADIAPGSFQSTLPGVKALVDAGAGLQQVVAGTASLPPYSFWWPSRVIPPTINEFPYWSFLFADLHPHIIGIPLAGLFLAFALVLIDVGGIDWRARWGYGVALLASFALLLGALAAVNLWELPTYLGLGVLAFLISQFRGRGGINWWLAAAVAGLYALGAYLLFLPFFSTYVNVGASGVGLVRAPDVPALWLLVWGFLGFLCLSWLLFSATRPARTAPAPVGGAVLVKPSGVERATSLIFRRYDRLPRTVYLHGRLVARPGFFYLLLLALIPITALVALGAALAGWTVLAICLLPLGLAFVLLWRRGAEADSGAVFGSMLGVTGLALLAGTQIFYLKDFLDNGDYYRMNTLFKFFNQVWVLWAVLGAIAVPRIFAQWVARPPAPRRTLAGEAAGRAQPGNWSGRVVRWAWSGLFGLLLAASLVYPLLGTPARSDMRMVGWRPPLGTLNGLEFMRAGSYSWPDAANMIDLSYDYDALQWLLANVRGNATILESSEVEYYRAWGTKIASNTGLSGLKGMHEQEQRYADEVGYRDGLYRELWATPDVVTTQQILDELQVDLIYVGQLEQYLHPAGVAKFAQMANDGLLQVVYQNDRVIIYATPGYRGLEQADDASEENAG